MNATNPEANYDAIGSITQVLILAAMKKQVVMFTQVVAACQHTDLDQVIRGNLQATDTGPDNKTVLAALAEITKVCKDKNWPPLTVLVTKDGKTVGQGFWETAPCGGIQSFPDEVKRHLELEWRKDCYQYFDAFSPLNCGLNDYVAKAWKMIRASKDQFPDLEEALDEASYTVIEGRAYKGSLSVVRDLIDRTIQFDYFTGLVTDYDREVLISKQQRNTRTYSVVIPVGKEVDVVSLALAPVYASLDEGQKLGPSSLVTFEIVGVLDAQNKSLLFKDFEIAFDGHGLPYQHFNLRVLDKAIVGNWAALSGRLSPSKGQVGIRSDSELPASVIAKVSIYTA